MAQVTKATNRWAAVGVAALDGKSLAASARILVVAVGRVENSNMEWREGRTSLRRWGKAPTVAEGITATIVLPRRARITALDGTGTPMQPVPVPSVDGRFRFDIGPQYQTLYYAVQSASPAR